MKNLLLGLGLFLITGVPVFAQAPQALNYQGVARNLSGTPMATVPIGLRLTVHDGTAGGAIVYRETQMPTTNSFGLYNISIGSGTVVSGKFGAVNF